MSIIHFAKNYCNSINYLLTICLSVTFDILSAIYMNTCTQFLRCSICFVNEQLD